MRLPRTVVPRRYRVDLVPDPSGTRFTGTVDVTVEVVAATREITLHARALDVRRARLSAPGRDESAEILVDERHDLLVLRFAHPVQPGIAELGIGFAGAIGDTPRGLFRAADGAGGHLLATHLEPAHARTVFPCWDEPDRKAVFCLSVTALADLLAVSNMDPVRREPLPHGRLRTTFADTPPMSSYLLALVVGRLRRTAPVTSAGVAVRVVHRPGSERLTGYALRAAAFFLRLFTDYFGQRAPVRTCDLIALETCAGAMENLGALVFPEADLLVSEVDADQAALRRVADVLAHELAHLWFGDLVTMPWWDELWLKEGFATFMSHRAVSAWEPEWARWHEFLVERAATMEADEQPSSRPVRRPVDSTDQAEAMFDALAYRKAAALLHMLCGYLGEDRFRAGVVSFLRTHAHGVAGAEDLWRALAGDNDNEPRVADLMSAWLDTPGHPEIEVDHTPGRVLVERTRAGAPVPVAVGDSTILLTGARAELPADTTRAVVGNAGGWGFVRVRYRPAAFAPILAGFADLPPVDQTVVLRDVWSCLLAGRAATADWAALIAGLSGATTAPTWTLAADQLSTVESLLAGAGHARFVDWLAPVLRRATVSAPARQRATILLLLGVTCTDRPTADWARDAWRTGCAPMFTDTVVTVVAAHGGDREHAAFLDALRAARGPQERVRYGCALARFRDPALVADTVAVAIGELPPPATAVLLGRLLANRWVNEHAWAEVERSWSVLTDRIPPMGLAKLLAGAACLGAGATARRAEEFLADRAAGRHREVLRRGVESLRATGLFARRLSAELLDVPRTLGESDGSCGLSDGRSDGLRLS
ncbi:M1 family metallopeptidase [Actinophytocola sediminis]